MRTPRIMSMVVLVSFLLVAAGTAMGSWFEDFEQYTFADTAGNVTPGLWWDKWHNPTGQQIWYREMLDTGNIYNSTLVDTVIGDNNTKKIVGDPYNYTATHSRYIGSYSATDTITVTAQVATTSAHSAWPLTCSIWVDGISLGISGNQVAYGLMPMGQKVDAGNFTTLMTKVGPTITSNTWYDVKVVVNQGQGTTGNDVVDLYYKTAASQDWTTIITGLDTGTVLGQDAKVATKICNSTGRGNIDNIGVEVVPEPATMALLALGGLTALRKRYA